MTKRISEQRLNVPSPFDRILATGFYDGPTDGFVMGPDDDSVLFFQLLDWDEGQDVRIFALSRIEDLGFSDLASQLGSRPNEMSAVVVAAAESDVVDDFLKRACARAKPFAVVATRNLLGTLDIWLDVEEDFDFSVHCDWFQELGLRRAAITQ
jgi:hypothetical protein